MAYIRLFCGDELQRELDLAQIPHLRIGRTTDNDLVLNDSGVSRNHASIQQENGVFYIEDHGSRNGVFLNKKRVTREKLKFWDEIQIHHFVIKFMAVPRVGSVGPVDSLEHQLAEDKTVFVSLASNRELEKLRKQSRQAYLTRRDNFGSHEQFLIKGAAFRIGRSGAADLQIPGWLTPSEACRIERVGGHYILVPGFRGKVQMNGQTIKASTELADGAWFSVRGHEFNFFHRLTDAASK